MARKKRTDEEAGVAAVSSATATQQSTGNSSMGNNDVKTCVNTKHGVSHGHEKHNRKGGEGGASRPGANVATTNTTTEKSDLPNGASSSPKMGSLISQDVSKEQVTTSLDAVIGGGSTASQGLRTHERRDIDTTGMSSSRKKNLKKKLRKQELKQQEAELQNAMQVGVGAASLASRLNQQIQKWGKRVAELETNSKTVNSGSSAKPIYEAVEKLLKEIQDTQDEEINRTKKPINKRASVQHVQERIREAELTIQKQQKELQRITTQGNKSGSPENANEEEKWVAQSQLEDSRRYLAHLKEQLVLTQQQSDLRNFQQQAADIKASLDTLVKQVQKAAQQAGNNADNRRSQQKQALWRRRLQEVGANAPSGGVPSFATTTVVLPNEASFVLLTAQGQPSLMLRKVERKFSVLVEKKSTNDRGVTFAVVSYSQDACESCATFLTECNFPEVPIGFATSPNCISLEGQSIGAFIGTGGVNLRKLEAEHDVLLWLEDKWITVLGREAAVKKAVPQLKEVRVEGGESAQPQMACDFKAEIVQAMVSGSSGMRSKVQAVEKSTGATVLTRLGRRGDAGKTATVIVKAADMETCKKAVAELENAFQALDTQVIECDRMKANRLLREVLDFSNIQGHEFISLLRCDVGVLVVAPSDVLSAAVDVVNNAAHQLARATEKLEIKATQLRILDRSRRSEIETLSGATCRPPVHDGEKATLTFTGHPDAVHKALELAQQILEEQKEEELEVSIAAGLLFLLDKAHRTLEEQHDIRIRVDVPRERLIVRGAGGCDAVTEAIKKMEEEVVSSGKVAVKLDVPRDAVPIILGRQGANLRRLQSECNLDNMVIDGRPQAVYMLGSQEAVDQATAMVQEIVTSSGSARQQNGADGAAERRPRAAGGRGGGRGGRSDLSGRGGAALRGRGNAHGAASAKPYNASVDDESAFPSLGVCMTRSGGRWQKKSPTPESGCDVAAKATSDEQADDTECLEADGGAN